MITSLSYIPVYLHVLVRLPYHIIWPRPGARAYLLLQHWSSFTVIITCDFSLLPACQVYADRHCVRIRWRMSVGQSFRTLGTSSIVTELTTSIASIQLDTVSHALSLGFIFRPWTHPTKALLSMDGICKAVPIIIVVMISIVPQANRQAGSLSADFPSGTSVKYTSRL